MYHCAYLSDIRTVDSLSVSIAPSAEGCKGDEAGWVHDQKHSYSFGEVTKEHRTVQIQLGPAKLFVKHLYMNVSSDAESE